MDCPECKKNAVFMKIENQKQEYFCPSCKLYFTIEIDPDSIEFEDAEIDDSKFDYGDF